MNLAFLQHVWFFLIGVLLTGYAVLDGFDLGAGILHLIVARDDRERQEVLHAVGPFWDGNEVWLLTGGGALFAAFPHVYATVFSGFYLALMLVLLALILRAVTFEFRSRVESPRWRMFWDVMLSVTSLIPALLTGIAVGNLSRGVPLRPDMEYAGDFFTLLNPYALLVGLTGLAMFVTHGAIYLVLKAEGNVAQRAELWAKRAWTAWLGLTVLTMLVSPWVAPARYADKSPAIWGLPVLVLAMLVMTRLRLQRGDAGQSFTYSALSIGALMALFGMSCYPYLVPANNGVTIAGYAGLSLFNASASQLTLTVMAIIALIGVPIMLIYTAYIYRVFRGKVRVEGEY